MAKTVKKDGGGKLEATESATVAELKQSRELQADEVVYDAETMRRVAENEKLVPGREYGTAPPNDLG